MTLSIQQTPIEVLDWTIDYVPRGLGTDTISTSAWASSSSDITITSPAPTNTSTTATVWVTGGIPGNIYKITNTVITSAGRTMQETIFYTCLAARTS